MDNYEKLLERISRSSKLEKEEIERKVAAKKAKLSGLISKEGAAQIVAAELGINFDNEKLKLSELVEGMKRANVSGKITQILPVREFTKNDRQGKVANFFIGDETSNTRVVLWDVNHIALIENEELKTGDSVDIYGGSVRNGEIHLSSYSELKPSGETFDHVKEAQILSQGKLKDAQPGSNLKIRGVIVQSFEPRIFESKKNPGQQGVLLNLVLDDGTETIRAVLFQENIKKLLDIKDEKELFDLEKFNARRLSLLGEEKTFSGNFRMNKFFNNLEMSVSDIEDLSPDELINELEAKS